MQIPNSRALSLRTPTKRDPQFIETATLQVRSPHLASSGRVGFLPPRTLVTGSPVKGGPFKGASRRYRAI